MPEERFPHLYLSGPAETHPFTTPQSGAQQSVLPLRDRETHVARLERRFEQAWAEADGRKAISHVTRDGSYVEFAGEPGFRLTLTSLDKVRSGIRLLNVRRRTVDAGEETLATVFIPDGKRGIFLRALEAYETTDTERGAPKNAKLFESISDVRLAVVESFWRPADVGRIPGDKPVWIELWIRTDDDDFAV